MKKRKPQRSKNKALKKKKNQQQQQARLMRKLQKEFEQKNSSQAQTAEPSPTVSEMSISNLTVRKVSSLSSNYYRVYSMTLSNEKIGYFGVYSNGYFNYAIIVDNMDWQHFLIFIKDYIRKTLKLTPIEKPRWYSTTAIT